MPVTNITNRQDFETFVVPLVHDYHPAAAVIEHTKHDDLTTVTGPAGSGKNTVMSETGLWIVVSDTTRDIQHRDGRLEENSVDYNFRGDELPAVYNDIILGQYVQVEAVDMGAKGINIYGSRDKSYPPEGPALIDVVAPAVEKIRKLEPYFASLATAYMVNPDFKTWITRLDSRGRLDPQERTKRLEEARTSLEMGLEDEQMVFINNKHVEAAARTLKEFAEKRTYDRNTQTFARNCGNAMLRGLTSELGKPNAFALS